MRGKCMSSQQSKAFVATIQRFNPKYLSYFRSICRVFVGSDVPPCCEAFFFHFHSQMIRRRNGRKGKTIEIEADTIKCGKSCALPVNQHGEYVEYICLIYGAQKLVVEIYLRMNQGFHHNYLINRPPMYGGEIFCSIILDFRFHLLLFNKYFHLKQPHCVTA